MGLAERVLSGDRRAAARLISLIEDGDEGACAELAELHRRGGRSHVIGVTGSPGAGKSTLIYRMAKIWREEGKTVGIVAVDPSSPFSGGALLGDRIRMQELSTDPGVFIRSMSSRGCPGGVARASSDVIRVLDALGMDRVVVETVGAGQSEVAVMDVAQTVVVVVVPGLGDDIQAIKAGILEIGDIFVINKADREGADQTRRELEAMLELGGDRRGWTPPIVTTVARTGEGVAGLVEKIEAHREALRREGALEEAERRRCRREVLELLKHKAALSLISEYGPDDFDALIRDVAERRVHPHEAVERVLKKGIRRSSG